MRSREINISVPVRSEIYHFIGIETVMHCKYFYRVTNFLFTPAKAATSLPSLGASLFIAAILLKPSYKTTAIITRQMLKAYFCRPYYSV